jgi:hypothetical protein
MSTRRHAPLLIIFAFVLSVLAAMPAAAQYSFDWEITWQGAIKDMLILEDFTTGFTNTSAVTDSFKVTLVREMPSFWQGTICVGPVCYPPSVLERTFILGPGESTNLDFAVTAAIDEGKGTSIATVESLSDPGVIETNSFTIITSGLDCLIVDGSENPTYVDYYEDSLSSTGYTNAAWDSKVMGDLTASDLANFGAVVWYVGTDVTGLDSGDRASLRSYVGGGGNLFLSGQNLAKDFCSPASPHYTPESRAWFADLFGIDFQADVAPSPLVYGVPGDPVTTGMLMSITGGDGANNNASPDEILTLGNGATALTYNNGPTAGVRSAYLDGRTFFIAFGFEGISASVPRDILMTDVINWIISRASAVGDDIQSVLLSKPSVTPNPFNPQTSIHFEVGGSQSVDAEIVIYDLRGRAVRNLYRGMLDPGPRAMVWNGRDEAGRSLSSGVYLAKVRVAGENQTVKMTLAR